MVPMSQPEIDLDESLPLAKTTLAGFGGAALVVSATGSLRHANDPGAALMAELNDETIREIAQAATRAIAADAMRLERLNGPFPGECADAVILPLVGRAGALVVIATNPAESALRRALIESRQRYRDLIDASSDFVWETDRHGRFVFVSAAGALGHSTRDLLGRAAADFVVDASSLDYPVFQAREAVLATDVWLQRADGLTSCQSVTAVPIYDADGHWCGTRGMGRDVTELRERERTQKQRVLRDRLMTYLADTIRNEINPEKTLPAALSGTGLAIGADGGMIVTGHPASAGYDVVTWGAPLPQADFPAALAGLAEQGFSEVLREGLQLIGHVTEDGTTGDARINGAVLFWCGADAGFGDSDRAILAEVAGQVGLAIAQLRNYRAIVTLSNTDGLTGLLNRRAFFADLDRRLSRLVMAKGSGALVYLDINNLKAQNDAGGHIAGDRAILTCAEILRSCTRPTDLIARIGGDEFLLWLDGVTQAGAAGRADTLLAHAGRLTALSATPEKPLGVSLGIAVYDGRTPDVVERLIARADAAMYRAKSRRKSGWELAEPAGTTPEPSRDAADGRGIDAA
jgi:diguanylate cyclase (GGDEF)-like protein/PAS domain S-box-containing protein